MAKKRKAKLPVNTSLEVSEKKRNIFLDLLSQTGKITESAHAVGYADSTYVHRLRRNDKEFAKRWKEAMEAAGDVLEAEAIRRASEGTLEPILYKGKIVSYKRNYSDQMLMFLLRGNKPEKYNKQGGDTNVNVKFGVAVLPIASKDESGWERRALDVHANQEIIELEEKPKENMLARAD